MSALQSAGLGLILGPIQVGYTIATFLFGLTTVQSYIYFQSFPEDRAALKVLVAIVWLADLGHVLCFANVVEALFVTSFGDASRLLDNPLLPSCGLSLMFANITVLCVQCFFAYRTLPWISTEGIGRKITPLAIKTIPFLRFAVSIVPVTFILRLPLSVYTVRLKPVLTGVWIGGAATDVVLTLTLVYGLHFRRCSALEPIPGDCERDASLRPPLRRTSKLINRLIIVCVTTGMITSVCMVSIAICFLTMSNNLIWAAIYIPASKFFSNSMLATLNSRTILRRIDGSPSSMINISYQIRAMAITSSNNKDGAHNQTPVLKETTGDLQVGASGTDMGEGGIVEIKATSQQDA